MVVARRRSRSRTPERGNVVVYCLQLTEMERAYRGDPSPRVSRHLPDLYGPSEQSLYDWCTHVWDGQECRFGGQWSYAAYLIRITILADYVETGRCAKESAVAEEDNWLDDPEWDGVCVESLGMRHYTLGGGTTTLLWDDRSVGQAQRKRWRDRRDRESLVRDRESLASSGSVPRTPLAQPMREGDVIRLQT